MSSSSLPSAPSASPTAHPHAPELGWARQVLGPFHVTGVVWHWLSRWGMSVAPSWAFGLLVGFFTTCFYFALRRIGAAMGSNLVPVLGPCGFWERQRRVYRTLWNFAWCYAERNEQLDHPDRFSATIETSEHYQELVRSTKGIIFVTAHIGHWEASSELAATVVRRRIHVVREEELDPRAQAMLLRMLDRQGSGRYTTHFASEDPRLGLLLLAALRQGDVVALQGDRPRSNGRTLAATIFGMPMPLPVGPAALARAAGLPLVPVFSFREGRHHYRVVVRQPVRVRRTSDRDADVAEAAQRLAAEIEWAIRQKPHQWFCFRRLWA